MVTGGAGFIGSSLVERLLAEGHEVDVVDDLSSGSLANLAGARAMGERSLTIHQLDVRVPEVTELIVHKKPSVIFHLAAYGASGRDVADPVTEAQVNVIGSLRVLEGAREGGTERIVFAADGASLYGELDDEELPARESALRRCRSTLGVTNGAVIDYLAEYRERHAVEFCTLVLATVYGPRQVAQPSARTAVVARFAESIVAREPVQVCGDGEQTRDLVYVDDVVDAFARAAGRAGGLVCNIGTGKETSLNALVSVMSALEGRAPRSARAPSTQVPQSAVQRSVLDPGRAAIHLGWRPWTTLEEGAAAVLEAARTSAGPPDRPTHLALVRSP